MGRLHHCMLVEKWGAQGHRIPSSKIASHATLLPSATPSVVMNSRPLGMLPVRESFSATKLYRSAWTDTTTTDTGSSSRKHKVCEACDAVTISLVIMLNDSAQACICSMSLIADPYVNF